MALVTIPNIISSIRLLLAPAMILAGIADRPTAFLIIFAISVASDFADGLTANILHQKSSLGARLDTWGDVAMYVCAAAGMSLIWPDVIRFEGPLIVVAVFAVGLSGIVSLVKHGHLPSYHTWGAKCASAVLGISVLLLLTDVSAWPFRFALLILMAASIEEISISLVLREWHPDVRSILQAVQLRKSTKP